MGIRMGISVCPLAQTWPTSFQPGLFPVPEAHCVGALEVSVALQGVCWQPAGPHLLWSCHSWLWWPSDVGTSCLERKPRAKDVSLKSIPLFISLAVKTLECLLPTSCWRALEPLGPRAWAVGRGAPKLPPFPGDCRLSPAQVCQWSQQMGKLHLY